MLLKSDIKFIVTIALLDKYKDSIELYNLLFRELLLKIWR